MKQILLTFLVVAGFTAQSFSQPYAINKDVKRILFIGNSITYSGQYISYIETYFRLKYPRERFEIMNLGLPSETVSGLSEEGHAGGQFPRPDLHERLQRVLTQTSPQLVFACYGMNDGIYKPFDDERFLRFREGILWLHETVTKTGADIIHITPPLYDERKGKAYANVLDIYADWLISLQYNADWKVIDIHWPMKKYLEDRREKDASFQFAADGVHPNETGHFIMARQILSSLGEKDIARAQSMKDWLSRYGNGDTILRLVEEKQSIMKDAWLTHTGHKRPGMNTGIPLAAAKQKADAIDKRIQQLLKK